MIKKIALTICALTLVLGGFSYSKVSQHIADSSSSACCEHDGDVWDN